MDRLQSESGILMKTIKNVRQSHLRCPAKTPWVRVTGFLGLAEHTNSLRTSQKPSNPLLQSLEGTFEGVVEQVSVNLSCVYRSMSECLLNDENIRGASIQSACEAVPERMWCDSFIDSRLDNPLVKTTLDLACGNSMLQLAKEKSLGIGEYLLAFLQVSIQDSAQLGVEKAIDDLSTFGLNGDSLLQKIDIGNVEIDQLRQSDAGVKKELDDHQVAFRLPAHVGSDGLQEQAFLVFSQEDGWLCVLVFDLNPDSGIVVDLPDVGQPSEESFDRGTGAIDGRVHFRLSIGLSCHWNREKKTIDISGAYLPDFAVITKMVAQQIQIALLSSNCMRRPAIGKLVIHELFNRVLEIHDFSLSSQTDEFALVGNGELREVSRPDSHPACAGLDFIANRNTGEFKSIGLPVDFFLEMSEAVKFPALGLSPFNELLFLHFQHCGFQLVLNLVTNFTVQGCAGIRTEVKVKNEINATLRW